MSVVPPPSTHTCTRMHTHSSSVMLEGQLVYCSCTQQGKELLLLALPAELLVRPHPNPTPLTPPCTQRYPVPAAAASGDSGQDHEADVWVNPRVSEGWVCS